LELKLSCDISKATKYEGCKSVPMLDVLSIRNVIYVSMLEVVEFTGRSKRWLQLTAEENSIYSTWSVSTSTGKVTTYLQYGGSGFTPEADFAENVVDILHNTLC
jgi:hypothetical protein